MAEQRFGEPPRRVPQPRHHAERACRVKIVPDSQSPVNRLSAPMTREHGPLRYLLGDLEVAVAPPQMHGAELPDHEPEAAEDDAADGSVATNASAQSASSRVRYTSA
jgi:hypothetical protein